MLRPCRASRAGILSIVSVSPVKQRVSSGFLDAIYHVLHGSEVYVDHAFCHAVHIASNAMPLPSSIDTFSPRHVRSRNWVQFHGWNACTVRLRTMQVAACYAMQHISCVAWHPRSIPGHEVGILRGRRALATPGLPASALGTDGALHRCWTAIASPHRRRRVLCAGSAGVTVAGGPTSHVDPCCALHASCFLFHVDGSAPFDPRGNARDNAPCTRHGAPSSSMVTPGRKSLLDRLARTVQEAPRGGRASTRLVHRTVEKPWDRGRRVQTPRIDGARPLAIVATVTSCFGSVREFQEPGTRPDAPREFLLCLRGVDEAMAWRGKDTRTMRMRKTRTRT